MTSFRDKAIKVDQYRRDGEVKWAKEGSEDHFARRMFRQRMSKFLNVKLPKVALDVGCGQGWLCKLFMAYGVQAFGADPSEMNIREAMRRVPGASFTRASLQELYEHGDFRESYDFVTAVMMFEHLPDAREGFIQLRSFMTSGSVLIVIYGEYDVMTRSRHSTIVQVEGDVNSGEVALRSDYGERAGVIYDIARRRDVMERAVQGTGLQYVHYEPLIIDKEVAKENPSYSSEIGKPYFHLMALIRPYLRLNRDFISRFVPSQSAVRCSLSFIK